MTTWFGAIADDFTGATDLAGLLARSGIPVSLRLGIPKAPPSASAPIEIIALKCRTIPVAEAKRDALAALKWLQSAGAERFYWKYCSTFDSTPEGNIGPIAEAMMDSLGVDQTIYCPAFPENGRSIYMGNLFVGEQPLAESPMKDHPLTPMLDSNLVRLLQPQVSKPVSLIKRIDVARGPETIRERLDQLHTSGVAHVIVDAVADEDLQRIAQACHQMVLTTGGSALAMPYPALWLKEGKLQKPASHDQLSVNPGPAIIFSGSCSAMTNRQVAAYKQTGQPTFKLDPLELVESGAEPVKAWLRAQNDTDVPMIYATAKPEAVKAVQARLGTHKAGLLVEEILAACAVYARDLGRRQFVVAGGETSGAVAQSLGMEQMRVGTEIAPGVPWCTSESGGVPITIAMKSGNFGEEDFFSKALEVLSQ